MGTFLLQQGLLGMVRLLATAVAAGWVSSPMSWSPDSRWLAYTVAPDPSVEGRRPGWLFETTPGPPASPSAAVADGPMEPSASPSAGTYRIWASQRDGGASVVIEESPAPMTAPRWSPRGRSLAFGRFVPESDGPAGSALRGRLEVVIQDGLERKRILLAVPGFELDDAARARFPNVAPAWSPDGQFLAFPSPGRVPAILVIRVDSRRVVQTFERGLLPSWSPDGSKLAYLHQDDPESYSIHLVERQAQSLSGPRDLLRVGGVVAPIGWGADGRSILAVIERARLRFPDLDLARIAVDDPGNAPRIFSLVPEVVRRMAAIRGIAIDFDRNEELCFFSVELEGRDTDVCWSVPRDQLPYKRFHPIDPSLRIVGLAIAPDGHAVAMRFGTPEGLSPPAVCELETEHVPPTERTTLIVADETARRAWLGLLARTARSLLAIAMPPIVIDGKPIGRPTVLPLPDEIPNSPPVRSRFARLGRYGASLCTTRNRSEPAAAGDEAELEQEDRLFFDYLKGDYAAATADLDALEDQVDSRDRRLALLSLRAQILWARGDLDGAREVAGFLVESVGGPTYRIEETPIGRSLVPEPGSDRAWARYLAGRAGQPRPPAETTPVDREDPLLVNPFAPIGPAGIDPQRERGVGDALPFAPNFQDAQREAFRARLREFQRLMEAQGQRPR